MVKKGLDEQIKELYVFNEPLDEEYVKKNHKKIYKQAVDDFGEWDKALRGNAVTKRKLKERQRFMLYALMKGRYQQYGPEALRPKNIDQETKDKIVESYKTLKALKDIIMTWTEDKALFELRIHLLSGADLKTLKKDYPVLHEQILTHYKDINNVIEQYDKNFGIPSIQPEKTMAVQEELQEKVDVQLDQLAEAMVKMNYIEKTEDIYAISEAQTKTKIEISAYIFQKIAQVQLEGKKLSMKEIYKENPVMYYAIKLTYKDLETAISKVTKSIIVAG